MFYWIPIQEFCMAHGPRSLGLMLQNNFACCGDKYKQKTSKADVSPGGGEINRGIG